MSDPIPLVDLSLQHAEIAEEVRAGFERVMAEHAYILGPAVADFEEAFAAYCGVGHCVGVGSGTDALELALRALDVGPGDEVLVPASTFIASALAVVRAGATPVVVDVERDGLLATRACFESAIGPRTRAIMPVDLYGRLCDYDPLEALCRERGLLLLEDAAQAQGASRGGRRAGSFGDLAATSFFPGKNIGAYGDGGAVLCRHPELAARLRRLRSWGSEVKYEHPDLGFNSRLDSLQAVVLRAKLARLDAWNAARREAALRYDALLAPHDRVERPRADLGEAHVWHLYVVRVPERDALLAALQAEGIGAGIHYPKALHQHGAFRSLGQSDGHFPVAEAACREILSLPLYPGIRPEQQQRVVECLVSAMRAMGSRF